MSSILSFELTQWGGALGALAAGGAVAAKFFADYFEAKKARERLLEAERNAFQDTHDPNMDVEVRQRTSIEKNEHEPVDTVSTGRLFNVYSKQIEKYQADTQARASWSFIFAVFSMLGGLGFVVWGSAHLLTSPGWEHVAGATAIAGIGGAIGTYIAKTFLDVHRLSLSQLNHYFRQPVINAHVLTGQRLADQLTDPFARLRAYELLLQQVASLIREDRLPGSVWVSDLQPSSFNKGETSALSGDTAQ